MSRSPDVRLPCGQTTNETVAWLGGCYQQWDDRQSTAKIRRNITKVPSYVPGNCGEPIDPYPRPEQDTQPSCAPYNEFSDPPYACGDCVNGNPFCGKPNTTTDFIPNGSLSYPVGQYTNWFEQTNETRSYATCTNLGWKSVAASKQWHGKRPYNSRYYQQPDYFDWAGCGCTYHSHDPTPETTRYLKLSSVASFSRINKVWCVNISDGGTYDCGAGEEPNCCDSLGAIEWQGEETGNATVVTHVGRYDGNFYVDTCTSSSTTYTTIGGGCIPNPGDPPCYPNTPSAAPNTPRDPADIALALKANALEALGLAGMADGNIGDLSTLWNWYLCGTDCVTCRCSHSGTGASHSMTFEIRRTCCTDGCCSAYYDEWVTVKTITINWAAGTATANNNIEDMHGGLGCPADATGCPPYSNYDNESLSITATSYVYTRDFEGANSESIWEHGEYRVNGTLSQPYTSAELYDDVVGLLAHFPLDNDALYMWRTDTNLTLMPYMQYDEASAASPAVICSPSIIYTGKIKGIPIPDVDKVWIPDYPVYCECADEFGCATNYILHWGAWSDELGVPSATNFTSKYQQYNLPAGAMCGNGISVIWGSDCGGSFGNRIIDDGLYAVKNAVIRFNINSQNYARPCGTQDRFTISESSARCFTGSANNILNLEPTGQPTDIATNDYVWVGGTPDMDGCWQVTKLDDYHLRLDEPRVISASLVASQSFQDYGTGMVARIRYQSPQGLLPAAICGRLDVTEVVKNNPTTCSLEGDAALVDGDTVIIQGSRGLTELNGFNWNVKVITPRKFAITNLNTSASANTYLGGGMAYSPFAADWKWNDVAPKGEYTVHQWHYNFRDYGEFLRLSQSKDWNAGLGAPGLDPTCCAPSCGDIGTCPAPTVPPEPRPYQAGCYDQTVEEVTCETFCLPYNACTPSIIFFSPNTESFKSTGSFITSRNHGFPRITYDEQYGTMWIGMPRPVMYDPIWENNNPCPCSAVYNEFTFQYEYMCDCSTAEDNGSCLADIPSPCTKYYPHRPIAEARCSVPDGAPPLTAGHYMGCVKTSEFTSPTTCPKGNICYSPSWGHAADAVSLFNPGPLGDVCPMPVYPYGWSEIDTPWAIFLNMQSCVCAEGRFASDYLYFSGVSCSDPFVPAP